VSAVDQRMLEDLLERVRNRFYGKYRGTVTDVDKDTCRIKAVVPAVLGDTPTGWCRPCVPYAGPKVGFAFLPEKGSGVWIEFEGGEVSLPIWVGCYWRKDEVPDGVDTDVKVIATASAGGEPTSVVFDNTAPSVKVTDPNENTVTLDDTGVTLAHGEDQQLVVGDSSVSVNDGALEVS
jgi:uncharacterized protein involved in type VI secretion and phage assembly